MNSSDATASRALDAVVRAGILAALVRAAPPSPDERRTWSSTDETTPGTASGRLSHEAHVLKLGQRYAAVTAANTVEFGGDLNSVAARILAATRLNDIKAALSFAGRRIVADRIEELDEITTEGAPDEPAIVLASLRALALFLLSESQLADPEIGVSPNGLLLAEWAAPERGVVAMEFRPDGIIQFAAVSAADGTGTRLRVHGELPKDGALNAVRDFVSLVERPGARSS
ncbi:MAG: hypothetical protein OXG35_20275 [Acidobacteria bacterium]|nr:hypothetical protein [Acidobacteriota bacterium]